MKKVGQDINQIANENMQVLKQQLNQQMTMGITEIRKGNEQHQITHEAVAEIDNKQLEVSNTLQIIQG